MGNLFKGIGAGGLLAAIFYFLWEQLKPSLTPEVVRIVALTIGLGFSSAFVGYIISWGWTQMYKQVFASDPAKMSEADLEKWRRAVYVNAMVSGLLGTLAVGVVFLLFSLNEDEKIVFAVLWAVLCFAVALTSPFLWKVAFEMFMPWIENRLLGVQVKRDPNTGQLGIKQGDDKTQYLGDKPKPPPTP